MHPRLAFLLVTVAFALLFAGATFAEDHDQAARRFDAQIAPLLARHCLECHDAQANKGELDLSRREAFLIGGESGAIIAPGDAEESLLWQYVEADLMPQDRPALSDDQKRQLREWIEAGAVWSVETIDPAAYKLDRRSGENWVRRLTVPEYIETVRAAVGVDIERDARRLLPPDVRADGFSNTAYNLTVDLGHVEAYADLAQIIVGRMDVLAFADRYTDSRDLDRANMRRLIRRMGKWLLRGPLERWEVDTYMGISTAITDEGADFEEVAGCIVEAMLQSPRFIYRIERQRGDGVLPEEDRVGDWELASRLSYILWGGPPDEELVRAADAGELSDRKQLKAQVQRLLEDPRSIERSARFIHEWLDLGRLDNLRPNAERFEDWNDELAADMQNETLAYFEDVAWRQNRPLADLMNAQVTYITPRLAKHYGLEQKPADGESTAREFVSITHRIDDGLEALYTFKEGRGDRVHDVSGAGAPLDLIIEDTSAVKWRDGLMVNESTLIATTDQPKRLIEAVKASNGVTIEAWVTPADTSQSGPARMVTLSASANARNFTLGQDGNKYDVRFRATRTDANGLPSVSSPSRTLKEQLTHVVYTRDKTGRSKLYLDGEHVESGNVDGDLSNWDEGFTLALANEISKDRPWKGTFHRVAIYSRDLSAEEIRSQGIGPSRYDLSDVPSRGGLLTHGSVLTVGGDEASMVSRGLFVLRDLLYGHVGDPPPCVDTTPVPTEPGISQRAIAEARLANGSCTGCHSKFEPFAFGLEKFDGLGAFHEEDEHGNGLRDDGEILIPGTDEPIRFESSAELMDILASSDRVRMNITRKLTQFAIGRPLVASDAPVVEAIHAEAQEGGGTYASLMTAIVMSDLVQKSPTEAGD